MGLDDRDYMRASARRSPRSGRSRRRSLLGMDSGLVLGLVLIGIALAALIVKGFNRPDSHESYDVLAAYDSFYSSAHPPVNVNTASREELLLFSPWISERIADGIIERRPFRFVDDLLDVRGIGEVNIEVIRMYLYGFEDQPDPRPIKPPGIPDA